MRERKLIGYCFTDTLGEMKKEDVQALDGVNIAFGLIKDGEAYWKEKSGKKDIARIREMNPDIKVILSIGGWEADGFSQAAETKEGREIFADSAVRLSEEYGFDGIDIDWEYPCSDKAGIRAIPEDKENFTLLLQELRNRLNQMEGYRTLSIAAGALISYVENTHMKEVSEILDYVQLMTYDLYGGWDLISGHHAGLYAPESGGVCSHEAVEIFAEAGVPYEKMVVGAAFYSRGWKGVKEAKAGSPVESSGDIYSYSEVLELLEDEKKNFEKFWDDKAKAAYLYNGSEFVSYEDERALEYKAEYVQEKNMYGMMYWEYGLDRTFTLTRFLRKCLDKK